MRLTADQREATKGLFLSAFSRYGNISIAVKAAGIHRSTFYDWLEHDEDFSMRYNHAREEAADMLQAEAWRRAVDGVEHVVISMGKVVRMPDGQPLIEKRYSDTLLIRLLQAHHPKYCNQPRVEVRPQPGPMPYEIPDDPEAAALARALIARVSYTGIADAGETRE